MALVTLDSYVECSTVLWDPRLPRLSPASDVWRGGGPLLPQAGGSGATAQVGSLDTTVLDIFRMAGRYNKLVQCGRESPSIKAGQREQCFT